MLAKMVGYSVELLKVGSSQVYSFALFCIETKEPGAAPVLEFIQIPLDGGVTGVPLYFKEYVGVIRTHNNV